MFSFSKFFLGKFSMRKYYVTANFGPGCYFFWESTAGYFWPWQRVRPELLKMWREYANAQTGKECVIVFYSRLAR